MYAAPCRAEGEGVKDTIGRGGGGAPDLISTARRFCSVRLRAHSEARKDLLAAVRAALPEGMAWLTAGMVVPPEKARLDDRPDDIGNRLDNDKIERRAQ